MIEGWWPILATSFGFLALAVGLISSYVFLSRSRVGARREKAEIIRESERRYGTLFNAVSDIVYVHDLDGKVLDVNRRGSELLGVAPDAPALHIVEDRQIVPQAAQIDHIGGRGGEGEDRGDVDTGQRRIQSVV